jgi:hypothetical protein
MRGPILLLIAYFTPKIKVIALFIEWSEVSSVRFEG